MSLLHILRDGSARSVFGVRHSLDRRSRHKPAMASDRARCLSVMATREWHQAYFGPGSAQRNSRVKIDAAPKG
jgi:hypothetical protein